MKLKDLQNGDVFISKERNGLWINVKTEGGNRRLCLMNVFNEVPKISALLRYVSNENDEVEFIILCNLAELYLKAKEE